MSLLAKSERGDTGGRAKATLGLRLTLATLSVFHDDQAEAAYNCGIGLGL